MISNLGRTGAAALGLLVLLAAGCSTPVRVTSDPAGVAVFSRGSGRASYQWRYKGKTPVEYGSTYNAELIRVIWPDGRHSLPQRAPILGKGEVVVHFDRAKNPGSTVVNSR